MNVLIDKVKDTAPNYAGLDPFTVTGETSASLWWRRWTATKKDVGGQRNEIESSKRVRKIC